MPHRPELGVNFSHRHADWLGQDPDALLRSLLEDLGVRRFRISVYWDEVAPAPGQIDFEPVRRWLDPIQRHGGTTLVTLGLKAQRWPEFYPPDWLVADNPLPHGAHLEQHPRVITHLLLMLERITAFLADYDTIDAWQVENEPWLPSMHGIVGWQFSPDLLSREIAVVRDSDPRRRPIVVNHSSQNCFDRRAQLAFNLADVIAENVYTRKPNRWLWPPYLNVYALWLYAPRLRHYAGLLHRAGKPLWITELQAEPWETANVKDLRPQQVRSVSPARIRDNLNLVTKAGAGRIYLWGAEWWRYTADRNNDPRYWDLARRLFSNPVTQSR